MNDDEKFLIWLRVASQVMLHDKETFLISVPADVVRNYIDQLKEVNNRLMHELRECFDRIEQLEKTIKALTEQLEPKDEPTEIERISRIPAVADLAGAGDGSVHDAVMSLYGSLLVREELISEAMSNHADPESPFFNDCNDGHLCDWCERALAELAKS